MHYSSSLSFLVILISLVGENGNGNDNGNDNGNVLCQCKGYPFTASREFLNYLFSVSYHSRTFTFGLVRRVKRD